MTKSSSRKLLADTSKENTLKLSTRTTGRAMRNTQIIVIDSDEDVPLPTQLTPKKQKPQTLNVDENEVSPTKRKRTEPPEAKPVTPPTPSVLLDKLVLKSPQARDKSESRLQRKQLFAASRKYQNARKALHNTVPAKLPGREKELQELRGFIMDHLNNQSSGTLYISGPPGTGKTASLSTVLQEEDISTQFKELYINCTAIKSSGSIYSRIVKELGLKNKGKTEKDYLAAIEKYLRKPHKMILLVLDEIDQLDSKNQSILYTIFEWPAILNSKLVLVGIANALDLTDRILPRLQAHCELKPTLMHFASYTKQQLMDIFTSRLTDAKALEIFSPVALQLLAGKVAAISGDVRRALDIGRRVLELSEQKSSTTLKSLENLVGEASDKCETVNVKHVMDVLNGVYGTAQSLNEDNDDPFPLQQKITVCSLLLILKKARNKEVTIGKLHDVYRRVCEKRNLLGIDQAEFVGLCALLETRGIIKVAGKKEPRLSKVNLEWDEEEVASALRDRQLMSMILQDDSCLGKM